MDIDLLDTAIGILSLRRPLNKLWKAAAPSLAEWGLRAEGTPYFFETLKYSSSGAIPQPPVYYNNEEKLTLTRLVDLNEWIFSLRAWQPPVHDNEEKLTLDPNETLNEWIFSLRTTKET